MGRPPLPGRPRLPQAAGLCLILCAQGLTLGAQALPPLPRQPLTGPAPGLLSPEDLLPLRPRGLAGAKDSAVPVHMRGKNIREGMDGWTIEEGAVESPDLLLLADRIHYNPITGALEASGHIRMEGPNLRMRCERLRMDWKHQVGEAWVLDLELPPSWVLRSDKVVFNTMKHWEFDKVELSPCPQEQPGWKAQVSKLTMDLDGYAKIRNLWIWVGNVPTFYYLPWAIYPAKAERSSGLLLSSLSFSGPLGASVGLPYYQVLGPTADATFSPEFYQKEGMLWGGEVRWNPETTHQGSLAGQFIDQRSDDRRRYRFNLKELWQREDGWQFTADINQASDTLLDADYGKGISRLGGNAFDSAIYVGKNYPWASFSLTAAQQRTYFLPEDTSFYRPSFPTSLQRQTLPSLQARMYPIPIGSFYLDAGLRTSHLSYKLDLDPTQLADSNAAKNYSWSRNDAFARMQGRLGQWGPFRLDLQTQARFTNYSGTLRSSFFDTDGVANGSALSPGTDPLTPFLVDGPGVNRFTGSARLQFSGPPIGRSYPDSHLFGYSGELKHVVDPFFALTDTSASSAEGRLPHFDEVDSQPGVGNSAAGEKSLEIGVKQHILGRAMAGLPFADLVRWKISTRFHLKPILMPDGRSKQGWASLDNDIDVEPNDKLRISFRRSSDVSDSSADNSLSADYLGRDGSRFSLAYFSTGINRLLVRQQGIQLGGLQRLWSDRVRLEVQSNYDFRIKGFATSQVALAYVTPCVTTSVRYSHVAIRIPGSITKEDRLDVVLTLRSLGDLGSLRF